MQSPARHIWLTPVLAYLAAALILAFLSHSLPRMLPGDFVTAMYGSSDVTLDAQQEAALRVHYQEDPGFMAFLGRLFRLDWGYSYAFLAPVSALFFDALPWTLVLMGTAHLASSLLGFVLGVEVAWRRGSTTEKAGVGIMTVLEGIPELCSGALLLLVFALHLGWFPAAGAQTAYADHTFVQRVADLLVADEPTSSLDPSVQAKVLKMLLNLQIEKGLTLLFVTHNIGLARKVSDRIGVMSGGRIIEAGPAARIIHHPDHEYTRTLIHSARGLTRPRAAGPL